MAKFVKEVTAITSRTKGKHTWKIITVKGKNGENKEEHLINKDEAKQAELSAIFDAPGTYEAEYVKDGEYYVMIGAKKLSGQVATPSPAITNGSNTLILNDGLREACVLATGKVMAALIASKFIPENANKTEYFAELLSGIYSAAKNLDAQKAVEKVSEPVA